MKLEQRRQDGNRISSRTEKTKGCPPRHCSPSFPLLQSGRTGFLGFVMFSMESLVSDMDSRTSLLGDDRLDLGAAQLIGALAKHLSIVESFGFFEGHILSGCTKGPFGRDGLVTSSLASLLPRFNFRAFSAFCKGCFFGHFVLPEAFFSEEVAISHRV